MFVRLSLTALPLVDIAVDGEDNIVVMGTFKGDMTLGNVALQGNTLYGSVFLAHYHRNGTLLWATEVRLRDHSLFFSSLTLKRHAGEWNGFCTGVGLCYRHRAT